MGSTRSPVETKVQAGALAAMIAGAIVWILQQYVFRGTVSPGVVSLVYAAVPGVLALAAGYLAPHTPRPVPPAPPVPAEPLPPAMLSQLPGQQAKTGPPPELDPPQDDPPPPKK